MTLLPHLLIQSFIKSRFMCILYFGCDPLPHSFFFPLKLFRLWPLEALSGWFPLPFVPVLCFEHMASFWHYRMLQGVSCIFSAPAPELDVSPRSSGLGVLIATEVVLFLI